MNKTDAKEFIAKLSGRTVGGYSLGRILGTGVSAAVYAAEDETGASVAIKVYVGAFAKKERLERELLLKDHDCPYLVRIHGGGNQIIDGDEVLFLVMEQVDGRDLVLLRDRGKAPSDAELRRWLKQLHTAAAYLLERELCHRDIKLQNIRLRANGDLVLLDMGILRPVGVSDLTEEGRNVGTRRYSPPELQHRDEQNDAAGFEALTVYQIGAVLYELIQQAKLFAHVNDYADANLVRAIDELSPQFFGTTSASDLRELATRCLAKLPSARPRMAEIERVANAPPPPPLTGRAQQVARAKLRFAEMTAAERASDEYVAATNATMEAAGGVVKTALAFPEYLPPTAAGVPGEGGGTMMTVSYSADIERGLVCGLVYAVLINVHSPGLRLECRGFGIYGGFSTPPPAKLYQLFPQPGLRGAPSYAPHQIPVVSDHRDFLEPLWNGPHDPETLEQRLREWADRLLDVYFEKTANEMASLLAYRKDRAESVTTGKRLMRHHSPSQATLIRSDGRTQACPSSIK